MKVNEKKRGRPTKNQSALSGDIIINTAKNMMEINGNIPSIRALATELGVDAMAIYYYFKNKNELLKKITTSLISDVYYPDNSECWQSELLKLCKSYLATLGRYDGLLVTLLTMESSSPAEVFICRFKLITEQLALSATDEKVFLNLLVDYIHGFSLAKSCDKALVLKIDDIDSPIKLICNSIAAK